MHGLPDKLRFVACLLLVIVLSGANAWWRAFSSITPWDDEGTLMLSVQRFFDGRVLYDGLRSNYGPLYYFYQWLPHAFTGAPVSHDSVRLVSAAFWVAAGLVLFLLVYRATGSLVLALAAHFTGFRALGFIGAEVAHPQEMCILLLLGIAIAACLRRPAAMAWFSALAGALAGAMALTKINLAVLVVTALGVVFVFALPRSGLRRVLAPAAGASALAIPFLLMAAHIMEPWGMRLALLIAISLASAILVVASSKVTRRSEIEPVSWRDVGIAVFACLASVTLIAWFVLAHGTTVGGMIESLVIWPRAHFAQNWSLPLQVRTAALIWAVACLPLAWFASRGRVPNAVIAALKLALAAAVVILGRTQEYQELLGVATPMLWLVAIAPPGSPQAGSPQAGSPQAHRGGLLRPLLAVMGVLQVLYAYPVAGAQAAFATVIMVAIAAICVWDTLPWLVAMCPRPVGRVAAAAVTVVLCAAYAQGARSAWRKFQSLEPLGLPGATRVRVAPELASSLRRLRTAALPCSMLVTEPGLYSLNLFSGKPAPDELRSGPWMLFLTDTEQAAAVRQIQTQPLACAVYNPAITRFWTHGQEPPDRPLVRFLREGFRVEFETGDYRFMVRK